MKYLNVIALMLFATSAFARTGTQSFTYSIKAETEEALLDKAQEADADVPFACKGGVCCTCRAKITEGTVDMTVNYALEPWEVEQGFVLACQAHPTSKKVVMSFDET